MLSYEEALAKLMERIPPPVSQEKALEDSLGFILAETIVADLDVPPFEKALMDGYAVRSADTMCAPVTLDVVGESSAGSAQRQEILARQAVRIMTGAPLPSGADAVQMVEKTRLEWGSKVAILESLRAGENVSAAASEVRRGSTVMRPGRLIGPAEIGVLATFGRSRVQVFKSPAAIIFTTGSELVAVDRSPEFAQIRNSNDPMLRAQCRMLGLEVESGGTIPDSPEDTHSALERGLRHELIIFSGGVSMGDRDYVHQVLKREDVEILFHKVAIRPGKPVLAGVKGRKMIFALPGNPVSCFVTFELFVRPAVRRWMGFRQAGQIRMVGLLEAAVRQKPGRKFFKPAFTFRTDAGLRIEPIETHGSADLTAFSRANSLLEVPADRCQMGKGEEAGVLLLDSYFRTGGWREIDPPE